MEEFRNYTSVVDEGGFKSFLTNTFATMAVGLFISAAIAYLSFYSIASQGFMYDLLTKHTMVMFGLLIAEVLVAVALTANLYKMKSTTAMILFGVYCTLSGVTFGILPIAYGATNTFMAFVFTSVLFTCMAIIGKTTSVDLSKYSSYLYAGLFVIIIISIFSMFFRFSGLDLIISYLAVVVFLGLTAWDVQKLKELYYSSEHDYELKSKLSIYGAFQLYLDFVNLFIYILRILGRRRD